jgi:hypothetical protein
VLTSLLSGEYPTTELSQSPTNYFTSLHSTIAPSLLSLPWRVQLNCEHSTNWVPGLAAVSHQPPSLLFTGWFSTDNWTGQSQSQSRSQKYFTTGGLLPISSSWRQAPWDPRPDFFFQLNSCGNSFYVTSSLTRRWVCLLWICLAFRQVYISHISHVTENFFLLHYTQVLCQYRLYRADHAYLTYHMLQRQLVNWST